MMISLSRNFIFVANLKSASTSIEKVLKPHSQIAIDESGLGKHAPITLILDRYDWLFSQRRLQTFFSFGVIRDPASYMVSLYNSHAHENFANDKSIFTGDMSFDDFLSTWVPRHYTQVQPQYLKFIDRDGFLAVDLLIDYNRLADGLKIAAERIGLPELADITRENASEAKIALDSLSSRQAKWIYNHFKQDYMLLHRKCNDPTFSIRRFSMQHEPYTA